MGAPVHPRFLEIGTSIEAPWSAHVVITEVLVTFDVDGWSFYGVKAETRGGETWDWPRKEYLLWIFNNGTGFRMWQNPSQPSGFSSQEPESEFERIVGHYDSSDGDCFLAVKWKDRPCPTWEPEPDTAYYAIAVTNYFLREVGSLDEARNDFDPQALVDRV
ncbi:hypothetical protein FALBO_10022 [Fusarium albosuccineum]|uniref:Chromo domain-containing protein n=1 Tax=Fusarium albosuccineum TaxID=1237068 RepID=A0A8H4L8B4_9HYPO|nr:hypothetical protein FALBO_10022 [Fusarium albosuccineum]